MYESGDRVHTRCLVMTWDMKTDLFSANWDWARVLHIGKDIRATDYAGSVGGGESLRRHYDWWTGILFVRGGGNLANRGIHYTDAPVCDM